MLVAAALAVWGGVLAVYIGPTYLRPLPMWSKIVTAVACCLFVAAIAIYGRRRAQRKTSSP